MNKNEALNASIEQVKEQVKSLKECKGKSNIEINNIVADHFLSLFEEGKVSEEIYSYVLDYLGNDSYGDFRYDFRKKNGEIDIKAIHETVDNRRKELLNNPEYMDYEDYALNEILFQEFIRYSNANRLEADCLVEIAKYLGTKLNIEGPASEENNNDEVDNTASVEEALKGIKKQLKEKPENKGKSDEEIDGIMLDGFLQAFDNGQLGKDDLLGIMNLMGYEPTKEFLEELNKIK